MISDFKPQEVSNTVWALATLRHFPGAKPLDCFINHAATMLERFKSQVRRAVHAVLRCSVLGCGRMLHGRHGKGLVLGSAMGD